MEVHSTTEQLLFATVTIETDVPEEVSKGTAFIFNCQQGDAQYFFLVTNKHVIADAIEGRFFFTLMGNNEQPLVGQRYNFWVDDFNNAWHGHPDTNVDIAVMPFGPLLEHIQNAGQRIFFKAISNDLIPTPDQSKDLDAVEEVTFVGYPNGIYDVKNLMPIVRRGITATPFQIDYDGEPKFLIDASVFPGSSGSPVFVVNSGFYTDKQGNSYVGAGRVLFLGVIAEVATREAQGRIDFEPIPTQQVPIVRMSQLLNLGIFYKSSTVVEAVQDLLRVRGVL